MFTSIILLLFTLRFLTACHDQFNPPNPSSTYIPSIASSCPSSALPIATVQFSHLNCIPSASFLLTRRQTVRSSVINPRHIFLTLLLSGDIEVNPGPIISQNHTLRSSIKKFLLYSLNIRSLLNTQNSIALNDLVSCPQPPDLIALQETWISTSSSNSHLSDSTPPHYTLHSFPRTTSSSKSAKISGGGTAFLVHEPAAILNSSGHSFRSFECSSITLRLASDILTVFNIYRPPSSSAYSSKPSVFLDEFGSFLSLAATTPNDFLLTGDFNIHVDNPSDNLASDFLNLLSSANLVQHVNFPTHIKNHTLDLVITSAASLLSPKLSHSALNVTDHYLIMADLEIKPFPRPPPSTHSYRLFGSIDRQAFIKNICDSQLILNPPSSLDDLLSCYNSHFLTSSTFMHHS